MVARVRTYTVRGKSKEERVLGDEVRADKCAERLGTGREGAGQRRCGTLLCRLETAWGGDCVR